MPQSTQDSTADRGQRRASFQQARSHATKQSLVTAATALWRANGYARTTVADICRAAGVSKALFYFYFPRKEDLLFEVGIVSTEAAHRAAIARLAKPYDVAGVITAVLESLEATMRSSTPELLTEAILEGYRQTLAGHDHLEQTSVIFAEIFERAVTDGKLPRDFAVSHVATVAQSLVSEGARLWAAGRFEGRSFAEVVSRDIAALVAGYSAATT
ncbi:TetR/AcrR family transcriptional regulator [Mycolicibacterium sp. 120270]|uniref:TetR/AcrR family transcriptional regulator n=1 Tax=Mycolicibacterium sp. 120270 TaxID=3090600 RepID=UPI00299F478F|nr:TetR/AcrR family transcriptional regulator [Mycolicibacterium sp. 120270]MDX1884207.1 TetR/AcrR family transcriptional regulator [Mycolicibacterium sp. 120270]